MRKLEDFIVEGIMLKAGWQPLEPYVNHRHKWKSKCLVCEKVSTPTLKMVKKRNTGCGFCAGVRIDAHEAELIMISAGLKPKTPYLDSKSQWKSECMKCGAEVSPVFNSIQSGQGGCKNCGAKSRSDKNRTKQDVAIAKALQVNLKPLEEYVHRNKPWKCECLICGTIVKPTLASFQRGSGCRVCAISGFIPTKPAILYLIFHREYNSIKIGITNGTSKKQRLDVHKGFGWQTHKLWNFDTGFKAESTEFLILKWLRKELKLSIHLTADLMPQNGHTETVSADSITVTEIQNKIEEIIRGYRNNP